MNSNVKEILGQLAGGIAVVGTCAGIAVALVYAGNAVESSIPTKDYTVVSFETQATMIKPIIMRNCSITAVDDAGEEVHLKAPTSTCTHLTVGDTVAAKGNSVVVDSAGFPQ